MLKWMRTSGFVSFCLFLTASLTASAAEDSVQWLNSESQFARDQLISNMTRKDTAPGVVIAAPSRSNPDYYYHWVRDASLAMDIISTYYIQSPGKDKASYKDLLTRFARFSRQNQLTPAQGGIGEPKFNVDGTAYDGPWGRPQNDGPALRAIALSRFALKLIKEGETDFVRGVLYDAAFPTDTVVKADLEFVSHHWRDPNFDLWEEIKGDHFYTRMVQRRSLLLGAELAEALHDAGAADWYRKQAKLIAAEIEKHWDNKRGYILSTLNRVAGLDYKDKNLDASVVLGALHGDASDSFFNVADKRVMATMVELEKNFQALYPINQRTDVQGLGIGRYPEDRYSGKDFNGGNPWVLLTMAFAEAYYKMAAIAQGRGGIELSRELIQLLGPGALASELGQTQASRIEASDKRFPKVVRALIDQGDQYVARVKFHTSPDGSLSEQIDRVTGYMTSAVDLTWSYGSVITAGFARPQR